MVNLVPNPINNRDTLFVQLVFFTEIFDDDFAQTSELSDQPRFGSIQRVKIFLAQY
jgi:hypothetical protein